jgi:acetyltransferase
MRALASIIQRSAAVLRARRAPRIRTIRPTDGEALQAFVRGLSQRTRYLRFFRPLPELPPRMLRQLVEADGVTEQVLVAVTEDAGGTRLVALAQTVLEADGGCEFALVIADDWQGRGLGRRLLRALVAAAGAVGVTQIRGEVLRENRAMLKLARALGFSVAPSPLDTNALRVARELNRTALRPAARGAPYRPHPA